LVVALLAAVLTLLAGQPAGAHVPALRGRLVDLVRRADLIVIGITNHVRPVGTRLVDTTITVDRVLVGTTSDAGMAFRGPTRFAAGGRYLFFLRRTGRGFEGAQESGTVLPVAREDDQAYQRTIDAIRGALAADAAHQADALRGALLPALSSSVPELRYHAALELSALARDGHRPSDAERQSLLQLLTSPSSDPALRPVLSHLLTP
jgi:hypothetical protein